MPEQAWISGPGDDSVVAVIGSKGPGDRAAFLVRRQAKAARSRTSRLAALKFQALQLALPCPFRPTSVRWLAATQWVDLVRSSRRERPNSTQPFRSGTEQECALRVGFDRFTKPSRNVRYLRIAVLHP